MAANSQAARQENMLPIMLVLGVMFVGICIAMNLFSRARFKKRTNAFAVPVRSATTQARRSHRTSAVPGSGLRLPHESLPSPSPMPTQVSQATSPSSARQSGASSPRRGRQQGRLGSVD